MQQPPHYRPQHQQQQLPRYGAAPQQAHFDAATHQLPHKQQHQQRMGATPMPQAVRMAAPQTHHQNSNGYGNSLMMPPTMPMANGPHATNFGFTAPPPLQQVSVSCRPRVAAAVAPTIVGHGGHHRPQQQPAVALSVGVSVGVGVGGVATPYVVPALTPSLGSTTAVVRPSHQLLVVRPLPAFLTEDSDLLAMAAAMVLPEGHAEAEAEEAVRILAEGDEAVMARIRSLSSSDVASIDVDASLMATMDRIRKDAASRRAPQQHRNYLPFAAKVIRKSVISAITASEQRSTVSAADGDVAGGEVNNNNNSLLIANAKAFCEEGYGFLLFATEEAGLTFLRAVERRGAAMATNTSVSSTNVNDEAEPLAFGRRPANVAAVRADFDEISAIRRRVHAEAGFDSDDDDDEDVLNASFSSSISSSSCDSATSFDSNSSFESLASDDDDDDAAQSEVCKKPATVSHRLDCDHCTYHRRAYRVYYRAKANRLIDGVRVRCPIVLPATAATAANTIKSYAAASGEQSTSSAPKRRPATFNGVPCDPPAHVAAMSALFSGYCFTTTVSAAGADGTVAARPKTKVVPLAVAVTNNNNSINNTDNEPSDAQTTASASEVLSGGAEAAIVAALATKAPLTTEPHSVVVHRPVLIDCSRGAGAPPMISFMGGEGDASPVSSRRALAVCSEQLARLTGDLVRQHTVTKQAAAALAANSASVVNSAAYAAARRPFPKGHVTHHRHCALHRAGAVARRAEARKQRTMQNRLASRVQQTPHVVSVVAPLNINVAAAPNMNGAINNNNAIVAVAAPAAVKVPAARTLSPVMPVQQSPPTYGEVPINTASVLPSKQQQMAPQQPVVKQAPVHAVVAEDMAPTTVVSHQQQQHHEMPQFMAEGSSVACTAAPDAFACPPPLVPAASASSSARTPAVVALSCGRRFRRNPYHGCDVAAFTYSTAPIKTVASSSLSSSAAVAHHRTHSSVSSAAFRSFGAEASASVSSSSAAAAVVVTTAQQQSKPPVVVSASLGWQQQQQVSVDPLAPRVSQQQQQSGGYVCGPPPQHGASASSAAHHQQHQQAPAGGMAFAALLPAWAQPERMNHASAKVRTLFSMSKTKRF